LPNGGACAALPRDIDHFFGGESLPSPLYAGFAFARCQRPTRGAVTANGALASAM